MTFAQAIIVYFTCWWLILLMALPIGIKPQANPVPGEERAAPQKTYLGIKCTAVTMLAALATWAIDIVIQSGIVAVH